MTTLDPDKLRFTATAGANWLLTPIDCAMVADALEIADSCARSDIECECRGSFGKGYDLSTAEDAPMLDQAVRYLMARGLIERDGDVVRFLERES